MPAYKDEARGTWYCRFRYTDYTGAKHETTKRGFKTKKAALQYEAEFKAQSGDTAKLTMNALCDAYLKDKQAHQKTSTYKSTEKIINSHIRTAFGRRPVNEISKLDIRQWQNDLLQKKAYNNRPYAPGTLRQINVQLNALFNYAVKYYDLTKNPTKAVDTIGKRQKRQAFWSLKEFSKVMAKVDKPELKLAYLLLFYSGMRIGELLALSPTDFDFTANTISISKSVMMSTGKITTPKTPYSVRVVSMPPALMKEVRDYICHFMEPPERIFVYSQRVYRDYLKRYAIKADVPPIHVHDLRHSHASYLIHNNVPVTTISRRLGHANASVTLSVYSHMYEESAGDVAVMLEKAFICGQNAVKDEDLKS